MAKEMKIVNKALNEIKPYHNNARRNDKAVGAVAASIREFGFRNPILIDGDGVIIAGHTRYKAAQALGLEVVPVVVVDGLTEEQIKAFRLADNKVAEFATWDTEKLKKEIAELDLDLSLFGFKEEKAAPEDLGYSHKCPKCGFMW